MYITNPCSLLALPIKKFAIRRQTFSAQLFWEIRSPQSTWSFNEPDSLKSKNLKDSCKEENNKYEHIAGESNQKAGLKLD